MKKKTIQLPKEGIPYDEILNEMKEIQKEDIDWHHGKAFGYVYHWTDEHTAFLKEAHNLFFSTNALSPLAFPSLKKFEKEVISMAGDLFHGDYKVVGNITSGGTESILMAVKTYRDWARKMHPEIKQPEIVLPISAHPAFNKAGHYFDVSMVYIPLDQEDHADLNALKAAINPNTILVVGSACDYPRGGMDPIEEMSKIALENEIPFHTDSCLGGYMLPFLKKLGYPIPKFDFEIPGVTSISADLHKYGHTAKGASTLIFRNAKIWRQQFHAATCWPGGIYASPTMNGTRPGAIIAAAWAGMRGMGENGYLEMAKITKETTDKMMNGVDAIPELKVLGKPIMTVFSFTSVDINVNMYALADALAKRGWILDKLQYPSALHCIVNPNQAEIVDEFLNDLKECVATVKANPKMKDEGEAAMYGMMETFEDREKLKDVVLGFMVDQYKAR